MFRFATMHQVQEGNSQTEGTWDAVPQCPSPLTLGPGSSIFRCKPAIVTVLVTVPVTVPTAHCTIRFGYLILTIGGSPDSTWGLHLGPLCSLSTLFFGLAKSDAPCTKTDATTSLSILGPIAVGSVIILRLPKRSP